MESKRKKFNIIANFIGGGWTALMGLVFIPVYIKYLGIYSYGVIGIYGSLQIWFTLLDMGLSPTINREMSRFAAGAVSKKDIHDTLKTIEVIYVIMSIMIGVSVIAGSRWLATTWLKLGPLSTDTVTHSLMIVGYIIAIRWMSTIYKSAIQGLQNQVWLNIFTSIMATIRSVGSALLLAFFFRSLELFFAFQAISYTIEMFVLYFRIHSYLPPLTNKAEIRLGLLRSAKGFIAGIGVIGIMSTILTQLDKLLLSRMVTLADFGYYALASSVAGALYILVGPISNVAYPRFTALVTMGDEKTLAQEYHHFVQLLSIALMPASLILVLFSRTILMLWTGSTQLASIVGPILEILAIGNLFNGLTHVPYMAQLAFGWYRLKLAFLLIATAVAVPALFVFIPKYGIQAAAWTWLCVNLSMLLIEVPIMHSRIFQNELKQWALVDTCLPLTIAFLVVYLGRQIYVHKFIPINSVATSLFMFTLLILSTLGTALVTPLGKDKMRTIIISLKNDGGLKNILYKWGRK
ncbi:oligosaccharide flippase family protein [Acidithiobacillus sp.]|jgi:O-antigen/teichoic acid export membrane protein|uniref:oligosaccharide flippase family protein n=1 Tax=Acidithiobacillus sp. TaxID=1872118 RepID=UPI0025C38E4B|nr:oligosaccharide flippase family protein [Acidithiobacillus sp.]MCK9187982.1 hypothetical protein [Acidithiobacillus sp.]MCK9359942.1 hypothetical protein [Acidithiobacillus sp.]